jgi:hypothetical protein
MEVSKITPEITLAVQAAQLRTPDDMNKSDLNAPNKNVEEREIPFLPTIDPLEYEAIKAEAGARMPSTKRPG